MSILKCIWYGSLVVSSQLDIDHTNLDRILGEKLFYDCQMYAFFLVKDVHICYAFSILFLIIDLIVFFQIFK